jgi:RNA polymerase sigma factor (sigma-70 family)
MQIEASGRTTIPLIPLAEKCAVSDELLRRLGKGDEDAAQHVFHEYLERLTALARSRLSSRLGSRIDPDDVVMSAYRSFFVRARRGDFELTEGRDLWHLLAEITLHKLYRQSAHHAAQRRSVQRETSDATGAPPQAISHEPPPEGAALLADELSAVMAELSADERAALELRLQGMELEAIAKSLGKSERTVRRWLDTAKDSLRRRFPERVPLAAPKPVRLSRRPKPLTLDFAQPESLLSFDDYKLLQQLGAGGSGKVYRALLKPAGTQVAVKFMKRSLLRRRELVERFINEAKLVARLRYPGIIRIHGVGHTPNRGYFLVMELCDRGDLQRRTAAGPIAVGEAVRWVAEAAIAIAHAHDHEVIHCDLKPGNLLLTEDGRVVVSDFGLARTSDDRLSGHVAGTPAFLAPEQLDARWGRIGPQTDVYGLGAVLYTLLAGRPPRSGSVRDVLDQIAAGSQPQPIQREFPPELATLISACLSPHPAARPASARQLAARLQKLEKILEERA